MFRKVVGEEIKKKIHVGYHKGAGWRVSAGIQWPRVALPGASTGEGFFQCEG